MTQSGLVQTNRPGRKDVLVETSYVGGSGVLLARSRRWLLLDADPPPEQLDAWWDLLGTAGPVRERLVEALEETYPLHDVSLVLVDLDDPGPAVLWGHGQVEDVDGGQRLTVGLDDSGHARPLLAGMVPAAAASVQAVARTSGDLIDGIPADILASTASGPPLTRPMFRPADAVSRSGYDDLPDDVEVTVPRTISDVLGPGFGGPTEADEAGMPVYRSELSDHLRQSTQETVLAVYCPKGHVTPAYTPTCRVCHTMVPPQDPQRIPRPLLGGLRLPTGELVPLDRGVIFGRRPAPVADSHDWPHLVHLPQDSTYISRMHLQIELDGWLVLARDLGSRGGTTLRIPGRLPQRIRANERYALEPGHALDLADVYEITYEVTP
jgi:hypothetical protein